LLKQTKKKKEADGNKYANNEGIVVDKQVAVNLPLPLSVLA
jgi:hypothetical protein